MFEPPGKIALKPDKCPPTFKVCNNDKRILRKHEHIEKNQK